jgi:hypothetical protein
MLLVSILKNAFRIAVATVYVPAYTVATAMRNALFKMQTHNMGNESAHHTAIEPIGGIKRVESGMTNLGETGYGNHPVNVLVVSTGPGVHWIP